MNERKRAANRANCCAPNWSEADETALRALWPSTSMAAIGEQLGRTRSQIAGKINRLKLSLKPAERRRRLAASHEHRAP